MARRAQSTDRPSLGRATLQWAWRSSRGNEVGALPIGDVAVHLGGHGSDVAIDGFTRTRRLARIVRTGDAVWLERLDDGIDLRVNGAPVVRTELRHRDRIEIGEATLTIWSS